MDYTNPQYLIDANSLNERLTADNLKVFDTSVNLIPQAGGTYNIISGQAEHERAHIPGAGFIDLAEQWADTSSQLRFTLPAPDRLAAAIGASGISNDDFVVLYSSGHLMWATRAWWLLRHAGHTNMAVLNGNFRAWTEAGLPTESGPSEYPATTFSIQAQAGAFVETAEVEAGMHGKVCTINALNKSLYEGTGDFFYQRRGHIPGSLLMAFDDILDNEYFLPAEQLSAKLTAVGVLDADQVITYCGGGIAATLDAFACVLLGQENVGVYDGSMSEWVSDPNRPLTEGSLP